MALPSPDSVAALLLAYWRGGGPKDRSTRDVCRRLKEKVLSRLPQDIVESVRCDASLYVAEISEALADLMRADLEAQALAEDLSLPKQSGATQQVSASGNDIAMFVAGRDMWVESPRITSRSPGHRNTQATGEKQKEETPLAYLRRLRQILSKRFDEGELRTLCFDLGVDYDTLRGEGKADKARELIGYLDRHDQIQRLVMVGRQLRPDISWSDT